MSFLAARGVIEVNLFELPPALHWTGWKALLPPSGARKTARYVITRSDAWINPQRGPRTKCANLVQHTNQVRKLGTTFLKEMILVIRVSF